ncbi:hypothetical protein [Aliarcobacter butzleri]|uniref:hypothetical protein n=1 Tax=Aliarcobacter butzleri TaxID=28197 RepID=UPI00125FEDBB|nr:hypothetical protein [Aliarcobacter butzleri]
MDSRLWFNSWLIFSLASFWLIPLLIFSSNLSRAEVNLKSWEDISYFCKSAKIGLNWTPMSE